MDDKLLIYVTLPATGQTYDFLVSKSLSFGLMAHLICQAMESIEPDFFSYDGNQTMMLAATGEIQQASVLIGQAGYLQGEAFVIV